MERVRRTWAVVALGACLGVGCHAETGRAPVVRFEVTPRFIPQGDDYATVVTLDGSRSRDEVDDPAGALPLAFAWSVDDPAPQVVEGSLQEALVKVRLSGNRPTMVTLTVRDASGRTAERTGAVGITVGGEVDGGVAPADGPDADGARHD